MSDFASYKAEITKHANLQYRLSFRNSLTFETVWKPTGNEQEPYRFITGAVFDHRDRFIRLIPEG